MLLNSSKNKEIEDTKKLNEINNSLNITELDLLKLKKEKNELLAINKKYESELVKFQNYKELPIEIDLLSQSDQGFEIIKKKLAIIINQTHNVKNIRQQILKEAKELVPEFYRYSFIKNKFESLQKANKEVNFHIQRYSDMLPLIKSYDETYNNNKEIIENIEKNINVFIETSKVYDSHQTPINDINKKIQKLNLDKNILQEKKNQISLYEHIFNKQISDFEKMQFFNNRLRSINNTNEDYEYSKINVFIN